jgi:hypothetical protein
MVHYVVVSAEIWCPHREETVVLAIFSALSVNGGKLTKKNLKGVGEIHQGKRFLHNCTYVQLVGNSSRNEYSKTHCTVINPPSVTGKNLGTDVEKSAKTAQGWKSAKLA